MEDGLNNLSSRDAFINNADLRRQFRNKAYDPLFRVTYSPAYGVNATPESTLEGYIGYGFYIKRVVIEKREKNSLLRYDIFKASDCRTSTLLNVEKESSFLKPDKNKRVKTFETLSEAWDFCRNEFKRVYYIPAD